MLNGPHDELEVHAPSHKRLKSIELRLKSVVGPEVLTLRYCTYLKYLLLLNKRVISRLALSTGRRHAGQPYCVESVLTVEQYYY